MNDKHNCNRCNYSGNRLFKNIIKNYSTDINIFSQKKGRINNIRKINVSNKQHENTCFKKQYLHLKKNYRMTLMYIIKKRRLFDFLFS